jgi:DNA-binding NarL/FixJ family response regulator
MTHNASAGIAVLAVDDSPETLRFLVDALEAAHITVFVAASGDSAIGALENVTPDVILLDAVMPGMDGFEVCRRIKANPSLAHLPVIFMTGLSDTEHVVQGFKAGGVDYITKPIVADELIARILVHSKNARAVRSAGLALEAAGRAILAVTPEGRILWTTAKAKAALGGPDASEGGASLPSEIAAWLGDKAAGRPAPEEAMSPTAGLRFVFLSFLPPSELILAIKGLKEADGRAILRDRYGLTQREAEVLSWLAGGKSNRDIAQILGISARTIDKYLEQIYSKLGVENRTSAAAIALAALNDAAS